MVMALAAQCLLVSVSAKERFTNNIIWESLPSPPPAPGQDDQPGLEAPFSGISNEVLLVAGGCSFPGKVAREEGNKAYCDDAFALEHKAEGEYIWHSGFRIPCRAAYGVSVTVPEGVICMGGSSDSGSLSSVFLMKWDPSSRRIITEDLPELPYAMTGMAGALVDGKIYLAGGFTDGKPANTFLCLDLSKWGC